MRPTNRSLRYRLVLGCAAAVAACSKDAPPIEAARAGAAGDLRSVDAGDGGGPRAVGTQAMSGGGGSGGAAVLVSAAAGSGGARATTGGVSGGAASAGGAGGPASAGSAGMAASTGLMPPIARGGKYVLEFGDIALEVDPQTGGRITRFALAGQNLLTGPEVDSGNWGSTFWPSPQQRWDWPPVPEIDNQPYTASLDGETIVLVSATGVRAKVSVEKRITARVVERAIDLAYKLTNTDSSMVAWAPWEISRVAPSGITFFPTGSQTVSTDLSVVNQDGVTWFAHDPAKLPMMGQKYSADGSAGWLAHLAGKTLFVKQFADVPVSMQAPAPEAEIAIYAAPTYVELEPQGPYTQLMPGQSVSWTVRWYARQLPANVMPTVGNAELVKLAASLAAAK